MEQILLALEIQQALDKERGNASIVGRCPHSATVMERLSMKWNVTKLGKVS